MTQCLARMLAWKPEKSLRNMTPELIFCKRRQIVWVAQKLGGHYLLVLCSAKGKCSLDEEAGIAILCIAEQIAAERNCDLAPLLLSAMLKNRLDHVMAKIVAAELHHLSQ